MKKILAVLLALAIIFLAACQENHSLPTASSIDEVTDVFVSTMHNANYPILLLKIDHNAITYYRDTDPHSDATITKTQPSQLLASMPESMIRQKGNGLVVGPSGDSAYLIEIVFSNENSNCWTVFPNDPYSAPTGIFTFTKKIIQFYESTRK